MLSYKHPRNDTNRSFIFFYQMPMHNIAQLDTFIYYLLLIDPMRAPQITTEQLKKYLQEYRPIKLKDFALVNVRALSLLFNEVSAACIEGKQEEPYAITHSLMTDQDLSQLLFDSINLTGTHLTGSKLKFTDFTRADLSYVKAHHCDWYGNPMSNASILGFEVNEEDFYVHESRHFKVNPKLTTYHNRCSTADKQMPYQKQSVRLHANGSSIEAILSMSTDCSDKMSLVFTDNIDFAPLQKDDPEHWCRVWKNTYYSITNNSTEVRDKIVKYGHSKSTTPLDVNLDNHVLNLKMFRPFGCQH